MTTTTATQPLLSLLQVDIPGCGYISRGRAGIDKSKVGRAIIEEVATTVDKWLTLTYLAPAYDSNNRPAALVNARRANGQILLELQGVKLSQYQREVIGRLVANTIAARFMEEKKKRKKY